MCDRRDHFNRRNDRFFPYKMKISSFPNDRFQARPSSFRPNDNLEIAIPKRSGIFGTPEYGFDHYQPSSPSSSSSFRYRSNLNTFENRSPSSSFSSRFDNNNDDDEQFHYRSPSDFMLITTPFGNPSFKPKRPFFANDRKSNVKPPHHLRSKARYERNLNDAIEKTIDEDDKKKTNNKNVITSTRLFNHDNRSTKIDFEWDYTTQNVKSIRCVFLNIESVIVEFISTVGKGKTIWGCLAWFSNKRILKALIEHARRVLFVINAEDHADPSSRFSSCLKLYEQLPKFKEPLCLAFTHMRNPQLQKMDRTRYREPLTESSYAQVRCRGSPSCTGEGKKGGKPSSLMHLKFLIIFDETLDVASGKMVDMPRWTIEGSFNYTHNANNNHESINIIDSTDLSKRYFGYFVKILALSRDIEDVDPISNHAK